jgi:hypothetical protein
MAKQVKYKLIRDDSFRDLMITHYQQSYAIQLLSYICYKHNLDTALSVAEACGMLGITPRQLEEAVKKNELRSIGRGPIKVYSAFDLVTLVTRLHRKRTMGVLKSVPNFVHAENPQTGD